MLSLQANGQIYQAQLIPVSNNSSMPLSTPLSSSLEVGI